MPEGDDRVQQWAHTDVVAKFSEGRVNLLASIVLPVVMILMAEGFFFLGELEATLTVHGINLLYCVLTPLLLSIPPHTFQAFSLISVLRILNVGMPAFFDLTLYWLPFIYGPIIVVAYFVATMSGGDNREMPTIGSLISSLTGGERDPRIRWRLHYLVLAIIIGLAIASVEYEILRPESLIPEITIGNLVLLGVVMVVFVGLGEEMLFRQLLQNRLRGKIGTISAILLASIMFASMHSGYSSVPYLLFVFGVGLILGFEFQRTGSLMYVVLLHGSINFFLFSFFPI